MTALPNPVRVHVRRMSEYREGCNLGQKGWRKFAHTVVRARRLEFVSRRIRAMDRPELDYAYLADFAQIQDGKLTAVGASFTHVTAVALPAVHMVYVAGRVRCPEHFAGIDMRIEVVPPSGEYKIVGDVRIEHHGNVRPYDGKMGLLFAVGLSVPVSATGLYEILIDVEGQRVRRLAFDVEMQSV